MLFAQAAHRWYSLLLLLHVVEERPGHGRDVRDLDVGHACGFGRDVRELHAAWHQTALHCLGVALRQRALDVVNLDADVVQAGTCAVQKIGVDALAIHRCDEFELGLAGITQRDVGDEIRGLSAIGARIRAEVDTKHTDPLLGAQQHGQRLFGGIEVPGDPRNLDRCLVNHRVENISGGPAWLERVLVYCSLRYALMHRSVNTRVDAGSSPLATFAVCHSSPDSIRKRRPSSVTIHRCPNDGSMASPVPRYLASPSSMESQPIPRAPGPNSRQFSSSTSTTCSTTSCARSVPSLLMLTSIQLTLPSDSQVAVKFLGGSHVRIVPLAWPSSW